MFSARFGARFCSKLWAKLSKAFKNVQTHITHTYVSLYISTCVCIRKCEPSLRVNYNDTKQQLVLLIIILMLKYRYIQIYSIVMCDFQHSLALHLFLTLFMGVFKAHFKFFWISSFLYLLLSVLQNLLNKHNMPSDSIRICTCMGDICVRTSNRKTKEWTLFVDKILWTVDSYS